MHFVNADGTLRPVLCAARFHPCLIIPSITLEIVHHGRGRFAVLIEKREWIALEQYRARLGADFKFVVRALLDPGQKEFPHTAADELAHRIYPAIPTVEIAYDADALSVRRPDCEINARSVANGAQMC